MKEYSIRQYEASDYVAWNTFVSEAKNATFLFHRDFMEYHRDRFEDFSLLIFNKEKLVALLPANKVGDDIFSHQGLTYGGLIYKENLKLASVIGVFQLVLKYLYQKSFLTLNIKSIPSIYHQKPSEDLLYALFLVQAKLTRREALAVIDLRKELTMSKLRKRGLKKGVKAQLVIKEETDFELFWNKILKPNLDVKHGIKPVHSIEEIKLLQSKFPKNIRQFNVFFEGKIVAGTTMFETGQVAHAQYISADEGDNELGSLDFLYHYLINEVFKEKKYFDFGNSNENYGKNLNNGLSYWKESFGASTVVQDFYEVKTKNYSLLENVLI